MQGLRLVYNWWLAFIQHNLLYLDQPRHPGLHRPFVVPSLELRTVFTDPSQAKMSLKSHTSALLVSDVIGNRWVTVRECLFMGLHLLPLTTQ